MPDWEIQNFEKQPIRAYLSLFEALPAPDDALVNGQYLAEFIGPSWLTAIAPRLLPLGGLAGWAGKSFKENGDAINLLYKGSELAERVPMLRRTERSAIDTNTGLTLTYDKRAPLPLRSLRDELRSLDNNTLLGMTIVDLPLIKRLPMPFLLRRMS